MSNETYALTKAEREQVIACLHCDAEESKLDKVAELMQSLPLITGEPVRYEYQAKSGLWFPFTDQRHHDNTVADGTYPIRPLYTHARPTEQALKDARKQALEEAMVIVRTEFEGSPYDACPIVICDAIKELLK